MRTTTVTTAHGPARVRVVAPAGPVVALLALGHGAGGDVDAPDLAAVTAAAAAAGIRVALVTQPYRVAGRRAPAPAGQLDAAWCDAVRAVRGRSRVPLVAGGRSSGARVACRTAAALGAAAVVALAFPLHPPGRPERSRAAELPDGLPVLAVAGERDPFGTPVAAGSVDVVVRPGETHDLRRDPAGTAAAVVGWLAARGLARPAAPE